MAKKNPNPSTKIVCPVCGTKFAIPEKTHVAVGIVVGADSGLGTIYPATTGATQTPAPSAQSQKKATEKIEALRMAGVNVDNLFSMKSASGQEIIARMENGNLSVVPDNDPIFAVIMGRGTVPNRRLFRRWVMAQVFHMLNYKSYRGNKTGFVAALEAKGYKYQWKMVLEEMRVQAKLAAEDPENFALRNRWFNDGRIMQMGVDYLEQLVAHINKLKVRHCKGVPYVKLGGRNVFTADIQTKVIDPIVKAMAKIGEADTPSETLLRSQCCCKIHSAMVVHQRRLYVSGFQRRIQGSWCILHYAEPYSLPRGQFQKWLHQAWPEEISGYA